MPERIVPVAASSLCLAAEGEPLRLVRPMRCAGIVVDEWRVRPACAVCLRLERDIVLL